jgi:hypothetical protein
MSTDAQVDATLIEFTGYSTTIDGEAIVFDIRGKAGGEQKVAVRWQDIPETIAIVNSAARHGMLERQLLGKSSAADTRAFLITKFKLSSISQGGLRRLIIETSTGFQFQFALPENVSLADGRTLTDTLSSALTRACSSKVALRA